jgi:hypothetical protein
MANLSLSAAWNETSAFVRREGRLLLPVAFLLVALPQALVQALSGSPVGGQAQAQQEPNVVALILFLPLLAVTMVGTIALCHLALRPGAAVGEAIRVGARRFLPLLGAILLVALAFMIVLVPIFALTGAGTPGAQPGGAALIVLLLLLLAGIFIGIRLILTTPIAAATDAGPVAILRTSWRLTGPVFWKLLGLALLMMVVMFVLVLAVSAVGGILIILIAGQPEPGSISSFLTLLLIALLQTVIVAYFMTLLTRIYLQLTGASAPVPQG